MIIIYKKKSMRTSLKSILFSLQMLFFAPAVLLAQAAPAAPAKAVESSLPSPVFLAMLGFAVLLLFAIAVLANVLKNLSFSYRDKLLKEKQSVAAKAMLLLVLAFASSVTAIAAEADTAAVIPSSPFIAGILKKEFYTLAGFVVFELIIVFALLLMVRYMICLIVAKPELAGKPDVAGVVQKAKKISFWDRFHNTVPVSEEQDIVLDHDYDGIKELDNNLPTWWKWGFYLTILVAFVYMWYYHSGAGPTQLEEYAAEVKAGEEAKEAYLAKSAGNVDENTVKMGDDVSISSGKALYASNCAACHAPDGGGLVGPNLTDSYWLHGGSISDVFKSIKYGWADKGMKSWKDDFSPKQIADLSTFIKSLNGTTPAAPKDKQGELYTEGTENNVRDTSKAIAIN
jgi:cytochrome c oxidase cbb3-type subunit 3